MIWLLRVVAHLIFVCGVFVFYFLPRDKYGWMQELDPSISAGSIEGGASNRIIFTFLLLILVILAQLVLVVKISNRREKIGSILIMLIAICVWFSKFGL
jgi:hypothetical protein